MTSLNNWSKDNGAEYVEDLYEGRCQWVEVLAGCIDPMAPLICLCFDQPIQPSNIAPRVPLPISSQSRKP